jgi:hypothetical protein
VSQATPLNRVIKVLEEAAYTQVDQPSEVGGIPFDFAAMLAGKTSLDLVILIDCAVETNVKQTRRRVEGLARALDLVRSRRSLTVVFVGPPPDSALVRAIATVARVLRVNTPSEEADIKDGIAVLLPLKILTEEADDEETWPSTRQTLIDEISDDAKPVLVAAKSGSDAVEKAVGRVLAEPIEAFAEGSAEPERESS